MGHRPDETLRRRIPQVMGVYLAAGWGLIESSGWAVQCFGLGIPLDTVALVILAAFLPPAIWITWKIGDAELGPRPVEAPPRSVAVLPFESPGNDPEDEIAANVARVLDAVLREHERRAITKVPTREVEAMEYYLRGRRFLFQTRRRSLEFAREMFQRAIDVDGDFALAYAGLADVAALLAMYFPSAVSDLEAAVDAAGQALELDPELAEAHAALGAVRFVSGDVPAAEEAFKRAVELDPRLFEAYYFHARACFQTGRFQEAADLYREATRVREDYASSFFLAQSLEAMGREDEAREGYRAALGVAQRHMDLNPDDPRAATMRAVSLCRIGRVEEGLRWAERALEPLRDHPRFIRLIQGMGTGVRPATG